MHSRVFHFALICSLVFTLSGSADAGQRKRKPWLSFGKSVAELEKRAARTGEKTFAKHRKSKRISKKSNRGRKIAKQAKKYKGTRYRFGGKTKKGLDCSGLINRVYADLRYEKLPRTSRALYKKGKSVRRKKLRPGDLVFFKNTYRRGISHVGIYTGRDRFIHAFNKRYGVTITKLSDPYFKKRYVGARRLY